MTSRIYNEVKALRQSLPEVFESSRYRALALTELERTEILLESMLKDENGNEPKETVGWLVPPDQTRQETWRSRIKELSDEVTILTEKEPNTLFDDLLIYRIQFALFEACLWLERA